MLQTAFVIVPLRLFPDWSFAIVPAASSKPYAATRPRVVTLDTVTVTVGVLVTLPPASRAGP